MDNNNLTSNKDYDEEIHSIAQQSLFDSVFSKTDAKVDILDICSGNLSHINLKQVVKSRTILI